MAEESSWRVFGSATIASLLAPAEIPGWFGKRVLVMPGEAAIIIRNGRVDEVLTEQRVNLSGVVGSIWNSFKSLVNRDEEVDILLVDTTPRDLSVPVSFVAKDVQTIEGECSARVRVSPGDAHLLLSLVERTALTGPVKRSETLSIYDIAERVETEWAARVFSPMAVEHSSTEFRGNLQLLQQLESKSKSQFQTLLSQWGIVLESFVIDWSLTETQRQQVEVNRLKLEEEKKEFTNSLNISELRRANRVDMASVENMQRIRTLVTTGEQEEKNLILRFDLGRKAMEDSQHLDTTAIDARIHTLQVEMKKREVDLHLYEERERVRIETERSEAKARQATSLFETVQKQKLAREESQRQHEASTLQMQTSAQERITLEALQRGADPSKLDAFYRSMTAQRMADRSDEKVRAFSEAEAARHNVETFKEAEDRERQHQQAMTSLSADMMQAAKQNVPNTPVQGSTPSTVLHVAAGAPARQPPPPALSMCACGTSLQPGWKMCPSCGQPVASALQSPKRLCPQCRNEVQAGWKACPLCGVRLLLRCENPQCQMEIQPGWKACPGCGTSVSKIA